MKSLEGETFDSRKSGILGLRSSRDASIILIFRSSPMRRLTQGKLYPLKLTAAIMTILGAGWKAAKSHRARCVGQLLLPLWCPWEMSFSHCFPFLASREARAFLLWPSMSSSVKGRYWIRWLLCSFHVLTFWESLLDSMYQEAHYWRPAFDSV